VLRRGTRPLTRFAVLAILALAGAGSCGNSVNVTATTPAPASATPPPATSTATPSTGADSQTFNGHSITFQYPAGWKSFQISGTSASQGTQLWSETFGVDEANFVTVSQYSVNIPITTSNIDQHTGELTTQIQQLFTQAGGSMESGPTKLTMGGFPALGYSGTAVNPSAVSVKTRIVLAFNNTTEYFVNCQSTGTTTADLDAGCDQVIATFTVG
jgi:hypothetical protein